jgi:hypothetical protein
MNNMNKHVFLRMGRGVGTIAAIGLTALISLSGEAAQIGQGYFPASATVINFDSLAGGSTIFTGEIVTSQYAGLGVFFNNPNYPARANANLSALMPVGHSLPNILFVQQHDGTSGLPLQILFSTPQTAVGLFFATSFGADIELTAYGAGGTLLEHDTAVGSDLSSGVTLQGFTGIARGEGIVRLDVESHPDGSPGTPFNFSIDDLTFQAVPEPSSLALFALAGLAGAGWRRARA